MYQTLRKLSVILLKDMLAHNAHVVYCSKYLSAKVMLVPIMLHYFGLCLAHDCNVNAHAKNIPTLLMTMLCPILCKRKLLITQRLKAKFLVPPQLGGICVYTCTVTVHLPRDQPGHLPVCTDSTDVTQPIRDQLAFSMLSGHTNTQIHK